MTHGLFIPSHKVQHAVVISNNLTPLGHSTAVAPNAIDLNGSCAAELAAAASLSAAAAATAIFWIAVALTASLTLRLLFADIAKHCRSLLWHIVGPVQG
jgi:hypothetical protein